MGKTLKKKTTPKSKSAIDKKPALGSKPAKKSPTAKRPAAKRPAAKTLARTPRPTPQAEDPIRVAALKAAQYAIEKKAEAVRLLDLRKVTTMTDFFVIATGTSDRQVKAIAENVIAEMRDTEGIPAWRSEGWERLDWVLIDFVDFVVHVFQEEARKYYNLERLWGDALTIDVEDTSRPKRRKASKAPSAEGARATPRRKSAVRVISEFKHVGTK
ncbi:MAG: ribosome silencing factor [Bacteroidota bacterium]|nr:ribosome silencing factor [Bacteroidota bacterium]MDP4234459.1 ribosome silencing factor [Bacteroidota bacterium]MDP4243959.1 ribosome silencing factor [Bacteroidota bacterium]MDP4288191.1 ribosome silencing factor [Bacteroidota bacterium]